MRKYEYRDVRDGEDELYRQMREDQRVGGCLTAAMIAMCLVLILVLAVPVC